MLVLFCRVIVLYFLVFFVIRLTGKRQISELQPFDLCITLLIADMASVPATNTGVPLFYGIVPIITLFLLQQLLSFLSLKSESIRRAGCGQPLLLIAKGQVQEAAMKSARYTITDLSEQLRGKDVFSLADVEYAILETNGELSVLLKGPKQQPSYEDFSMPSPLAEPPLMLVQDGAVHDGALKRAGHDKAWLKKQLLTIGCDDISNVFFVFLDSSDMLHVQLNLKAGAQHYFIDTAKKDKGKGNS